MTNIAIYNTGKQFLQTLTSTVAALFQSYGQDAVISPYNTFPLMYTAAKYVKFDIAFIELCIGAVDGFAIARRLKELLPDLKVVFVTVHTDLYYNAIEYIPLSFIRTPYLVEDFDRLGRNIVSAVRNGDVHLTFKSMGRNISLKLDEIMYAEYNNRYISLYTGGTDAPLTIHMTMKTLLYYINSDIFMQINRNTAVNIGYITTLSKLEATLIDGHRLIIGKCYYSKVFQRHFTYNYKQKYAPCL